MEKLSLEEKVKHSSALVPYSYYKCLMPRLYAISPLHWHKEIELSYVIDGCGEFTVGDEKILAYSGDIIIVPPNTLHSVKEHGSNINRYDTLVFSPQILGAGNDDRCTAACIKPIVIGKAGINHRITREHPYYDEIKTSVENIFSCARANTPQHDLLLKSEMLRLFWLLENSGDIYMRQKTELARDESLRPAFDYIDKNFQSNITISTLAKVSHLSSSYFMGLFKAATGVGAIQYITQLRAKNACKLLGNSDMSIADVAFECGFRNLSNFNKQFKKLIGCTPGEYRKANRS